MTSRIYFLESILDRADALAARIPWPGYTRLALAMDIEFVHADIVRLDLAALARAPDFDFAHDVIGIWNHYNRISGKLEGGFLPRFAIVAKQEGIA